MGQLKFFFLVFFILILTACGEVFYCRNPSAVALVNRLPCANCVFMGTVGPDFCPDGTYSHKLQCSAEKHGANVVLLQKQAVGVKPAFPVYACPPVGIHETPRNDKTDISHRCTYY